VEARRTGLIASLQKALPRQFPRAAALKSSMAHTKWRKLTVVNDDCRPASLRWPTESTGCAAIGRQSGKCSRYDYVSP
jgi:hypothetical protein